jgi:hypothetical protein
MGIYIQRQTGLFGLNYSGSKALGGIRRQQDDPISLLFILNKENKRKMLLIFGKFSLYY